MDNSKIDCNKENLKTKSKLSKKKYIILVLIIICAISAISGITAYLKIQQQAVNVFTIGNVKITLTEEGWDEARVNGTIPLTAQHIESGAEIPKAPVVNNTGKNPAYVYCKIYVPLFKEQELFDFKYSVNEPNESASGWVKRSNEYHMTKEGEDYNIYEYEYSTALNPGESTVSVFNNVKFSKDILITSDDTNVMGQPKRITVKAYAIQTENGVNKNLNQITAKMSNETSESKGLIGQIRIGNLYVSNGGTVKLLSGLTNVPVTIENIENVTYASSNTTVATIDNEGKINTLSEGTTTISINGSNMGPIEVVLNVTNILAEVSKNSNGISIKIDKDYLKNATKLELLQDTTSLAVYNYSEGQNIEDQNMYVLIPFGSTKAYTIKLDDSVSSQLNITNDRCIYNAQDLSNFANTVNSGNEFYNKNIDIVNDIDLGSVCSETIGSWTPIGTSTYSFKGIFNGNNHKIEKFYLNDTTHEYRGLFYSNRGTICNTLIYGKLNGYNNCGAISGANYGNINNCTSYASVNGNNICGGIAGFNYGKITDCSNYGIVAGYKSIGGIVGVAAGNTESEKCYIQNCYNGNNITAVTYNAGGIAGCTNRGKVYIDRCANKGYLKSNWNSGGIVGTFDGGYLYIADCYCIGTVNVTREAINDGGNSGGILGNQNAFTYSYANSYISNSYFIGTLIAPVNKGGIVGLKNSGDCTITNCYYDSNCNDNTNNGGTSVGANSLKTYADILGTENWVADTNEINDGYPVLRWQVQ